MLTFQLTNRAGDVLATFVKRGAGQVQVALNEKRTAQVTLSIYDPSVAPIFALKTYLKVLYGDHLCFWGPVTTPTWTASSPSASTVVVQAQDPFTLALEQNFHRYGDPTLDGYPNDGVGVGMIYDVTVPGPGLTADGVPHPGCFMGLDETTPAGIEPADIDNPTDSEGFWTKAERGQNAWDSMTQLMAGQAHGVELDVRPIDATHDALAPGVAWEPGYFCEVNRYAMRMTDLRGTVVMHRGFGRHDLESLTWQPDGMKVCNYSVQVTGQEDPADENHRRLVQDLSSMIDYGIMERFELAGSKDVGLLLEEKAHQIVLAYSEPPNYVTVVPVAERVRGVVGAGEPYRWLDHFEVGDRITVACRQGYMPPLDLDARVMRVTLDDAGQAKPVKTTVDLVPTLVDADGEPLGG